MNRSSMSRSSRGFSSTLNLLCRPRHIAVGAVWSAMALWAMVPSGPVLASAADAASPVSESREHRNRWPQASLQAQAQTEVAQDTVRIVLAAEISDTSQQAVAKALTDTVNAAMEKAKADAQGIKVTTGNYRVWPMNDKDGNISNWRGVSQIVLESQDFEATSSLAASLSDLMAISSVNFFVSPRTRALEEQKLLERAARAFRDRALALAQALGYERYALRNIELGGAGVQYEMMARATAQPMMYAAADSVALEGGTETISVSIHGSVFLLDEIKE